MEKRAVWKMHVDRRGPLVSLRPSLRAWKKLLTSIRRRHQSMAQNGSHVLIRLTC